MPLHIAMRSAINSYAAGADLDACGTADFSLRADNFQLPVSSKREIVLAWARKRLALWAHGLRVQISWQMKSR
jgi:hypothetical protein